MTTETDYGGAGRDVIHVRYGLLSSMKSKLGQETNLKSIDCQTEKRKCQREG